MSTMAENQSLIVVEHGGLACKEILGKWLTYPLPPCSQVKLIWVRISNSPFLVSL